MVVTFVSLALSFVHTYNAPQRSRIYRAMLEPPRSKARQTSVAAEGGPHSPQGAVEAVPRDRILLALRRLFDFMWGEFQGSRAIDSLTTAQLGVLGALSPRPLSMSAIAQARGVSRATATGMVDRLVGRGLVERFAAPNNRKVILVRLTPEGKRLRDLVMERAYGRISQWMGLLTPEEQQKMVDVMEALQRVLPDA